MTTYPNYALDGIIPPAPPLSMFRHNFTPPDLDASIRKAFGMPPRRPVAAPVPRLHKGDRVKVTSVGYVRNVNGDGTYDVADTREPYADPNLTSVPRSAVELLSTAPAEPLVGQVITGRQVRETPWRRGTTLVDEAGEGDTFVLLASGRWVNVDIDAPHPGLFDFDEFDGGELLVESAPGKASV